MQTIILSTNEVGRAAGLLKKGEPVAIPTETVYGLAAPIFDASAIQKIFSLKGRPSDNPLIAHVATFAMLDAVAKDLPPFFRLLANAFWPGPLTLVLPRRESVPPIAMAHLPTIAIRMPSHPFALRLIEAMGEPLVAPSANLSGRPSPTVMEHVLEDFSGKLAAVVDGGPCALGIESTVLSLVHEVPRLLRPGYITKEQIEAVLQCEILPADHGPALSPGMKYRHYAPKAPVRLVTELPPTCDRDSFILSTDPTGISVYRPLHAKSLYAFFREADRIGVKEIWVLLDFISLANEALMNRLHKAAE